jgi:hypothetical protein
MLTRGGLCPALPKKGRMNRSRMLTETAGALNCSRPVGHRLHRLPRRPIRRFRSLNLSRESACRHQEPALIDEERVQLNSVARSSSRMCTWPVDSDMWPCQLEVAPP